MRGGRLREVVAKGGSTVLLFEEAFIKVMKFSVSILKADSVHLCHLQLFFSIDRIRSIYGHKQISMTSGNLQQTFHSGH